MFYLFSVLNCFYTRDKLGLIFPHDDESNYHSTTPLPMPVDPLDLDPGNSRSTDDPYNNQYSPFM